MGKKIVLGTDPEYFVVDANDRIMPSKLYLMGPTEIAKGVAVHSDNIMWELTMEPSTSPEDMWEKLSSAWANIELLTGGRVINTSAIEAPKDFLDEWGMEFGCSPYLNIYGGEACTDSVKASNMRFAGGHIHISTSNDPVEMVEALDKEMFTIISRDNSMRRLYYGVPGSYRVKPYGLEYRPPSNHWTFSLSSIKEVFGTVADVENSLSKTTIKVK